MTDTTIRHAGPDDLPAVTAIYNHYIETTAITFDTLPMDWRDRLDWFEKFAPGTRHQLLVLSQDTSVCGYASSGPLRPKAAYDRSVETSIYLAPEHTGRGDGRRLYGALIDRLRSADDVTHRCYGIITQPNEPSMALHARLGFREVARLGEVGFKFDRYWDTVWMELAL